MENSILSIEKEHETLPSPESVINAFRRLVNTLSDNTATALRTTNDLIFESLDASKTMIEHTSETTKQIFDITFKEAKTFEYNTT